MHPRRRELGDRCIAGRLTISRAIAAPMRMASSTPRATVGGPCRSEDRLPRVVFQRGAHSLGGVVGVLVAVMDAATVADVVAVLLGAGPDLRGVVVTA